MRLFVALTPPAEVVDELRGVVAAVSSNTVSSNTVSSNTVSSNTVSSNTVPSNVGGPGAPGLRWTPPQQWHVTVVFLGEVGDNTLDDLTRRLHRAASRHPPLSLAFAGGGRFGHRVLWTAVHGDRAALRSLADSTRAAARRSGLPVEHRTYRPHLTLARAEAGADLRPLVRVLTGWQGSPWTAQRLHLICSRLGAAPDGTALHEPIEHWTLSGQRH